MIIPGKTYTRIIRTRLGGLPVAADSLPSAVLWRNGSATAVPVNVSTTSNIGIYHSTFTADASWDSTDDLWIVATAVIDGETFIEISWASFGESDSKDDIATAIAQYDQRDEDSTPGTIGWYFKKLRQANLTVEAVVTNDITPTPNTFSVNLTVYPTGAFRHTVMTVVEDSVILEQNSPIESFTNNTTYSTIVLEESLTGTPQPGDIIVIGANTHVHSIQAIANGVWGTLAAGYSAASTTFGGILYSIGTMIEYAANWQWKSASLTNFKNMLYDLFQRNPAFITERSSDDDKALTFSWPNSTDTISAEVSIDTGSYIPVSGTISYLRPEGTKHYFTLSYSANDRPSEEGTARYRFYSNNHTMYATLRVTRPYTEELANAVALMNSKLSSSTISIISPLSSDGTTLNVIQGDDYLTVDNRNILFTGDVTDQWLDLTDSTVIIGVYGTSISKECVVISATGMQQISLELTSSDTNIPQGTYDYDVQATLSNGSVITLFRGKFTCSKSYTN